MLSPSRRLYLEGFGGFRGYLEVFGKHEIRCFFQVWTSDENCGPLNVRDQRNFAKKSSFCHLLELIKVVNQLIKKKATHFMLETPSERCLTVMVSPYL